MSWSKVACLQCSQYQTCSPTTRMFINYCGSDRKNVATRIRSAPTEAAARCGINKVPAETAAPARRNLRRERTFVFMMEQKPEWMVDTGARAPVLLFVQVVSHRDRFRSGSSQRDAKSGTRDACAPPTGKNLSGTQCRFGRLAETVARHRATPWIGIRQEHRKAARRPAAISPPRRGRPPGSGRGR